MRDRGFSFSAWGKSTSTGGRLKAKNLLLMPQRLALALQADGWILRSRMPGGERPDIIWRSNKMPESVRDRPTKDYEDVMIFAKSSRYAWDQEAGREGASPTTTARPHYDNHVNNKTAAVLHAGQETSGLGQNNPQGGRNMRAAWTPGDVIERAPMRELWDIPSEPTSADHFAAWPEMLAARLIAVGTSERGCCPECGAGWVRVVESVSVRQQAETIGRGFNVQPKAAERHATGGGQATDATTGLVVSCGMPKSPATTTKGWAPTCSHYPDTENGATAPDDWPIEPCRVLDPFTGIGRTWQAARRLGRQFFGVDLSPGYCLTARRRNAEGLPVVKTTKSGEQASLFEAGVE